MAIDCLNLGLQILVENWLRYCRILCFLAAEREAGIVASVGFQHTYVEILGRLKSVCWKGDWSSSASGLFGALASFSEILSPKRMAGNCEREIPGYWIRLSNNGFSHLVNLILFWLGELWILGQTLRA